MRVAIYIQASDEMDINQDRLRPLVERAKAEGWQYKIFSEIPDKNGNQPLKKNLLVRVYKKEFDTILVYKLSDLSSSPEQLSMELSEMHIGGIRVISCFENFDSFSITGKLYSQVLLTMSEIESLIDTEIRETEKSKIKSVEHPMTGHNSTENRITGKSPASLNDFRRDVIPAKIDNSGRDLIHNTKKDFHNTHSFDLIGLNEACDLTGYSRHTLYQFTSKKLIPHFKRPHGRRIFFSKRALEQWILTGEM